MIATSKNDTLYPELDHPLHSVPARGVSPSNIMRMLVVVVLREGRGRGVRDFGAPRVVRRGLCEDRVVRRQVERQRQRRLHVVGEHQWVGVRQRGGYLLLLLLRKYCE